MYDSNLPPDVSSNGVNLTSLDETYVHEWCDTCDRNTDQTIYTHPDIAPYMECEICDTETELGDDYGE